MSTLTKSHTTRYLILFVCSVGVFAFAMSLLAKVTSVSAQQLDLDAIMPCGTPTFTGKQTAEQCSAARDAFMQNCTSCHTFIPIVLLQKDETGWNATLTQHRPLAPEISQTDFDLIGQFLKDHFRPDRSVPNLPKSLIDNDAGFPF